MTESPAPRHRRLGHRRITVIGVVAGLLASAAIALALNGSLAGFVASITNSNDTAGTGYLAMQESSTVNSVVTTCTSNSASISTDNATCTGINKYGGNLAMAPGGTATTTVTITNTGTVAANTFTMAFGACAQTNNGSVNGTGANLALCKQMTLSTTQGGTALAGASGTAYALGGGTLAQPGTTVTLNAPIAPNASVVFVFTVTFTSTGSGSGDDPLQGLAISQPITWTFGS